MSTTSATPSSNTIRPTPRSTRPMPRPTRRRSRPRSRRSARRAGGDPGGAALAGDQRGRLQLSRPRLRPEGTLSLADQRRPAGHAAAGAQGHRRRARATISRSSSRESTISPDPAKQVARETGAKYGGVLYVDSLSEADGPVPTYLDLLRVTSETIAKGLANERSSRSRHAFRRRGRAALPCAAPLSPIATATRRFATPRSTIPTRHDHRAGRRQRQRQVDPVQGDHGLCPRWRAARSRSSACPLPRR